VAAVTLKNETGERVLAAFKKTPLTLIYAAIGVLSVLLLSVVTSRFVYPFDTGHYEAFNWQPARHVLMGKSPYSFAFAPPYSMAPYGIVYYALLAAGVGLFGFQLLWGRILSFLAFTACLWAVAKITKKISKSTETSLVALLAGLAVFPAQGWVAVMRPDFVALAFSLMAVLLVFGAEGRRAGFWRLVGAVLLSAAAFFTKQTFLLVPVVCALRLLQLRNWRGAFWFASSYVTLAGAGVLLLDYVSSGGYVWQHFTHARTLPYSFANSLYLAGEVLKVPTAIIFGGGLLTFAYEGREALYKAGGGRLIKLLRSSGSLILFYLLLSFLWAFLSAGRAGANLNYYLENSMAMAICFALIHASFKRKGRPIAASLMVILMTLGGSFQLARILRGEYFRWQALNYYREVSGTAAKLTPPNSTCVSVYPELVVRNGCQFHFDDFGEYVGGWSPGLSEIFARELRAGRYPVIIWNTNDLQAQFPNYHLVPMSQSPPERFLPVYLYVRSGDAPQ